MAQSRMSISMALLVALLAAFVLSSSVPIVAGASAAAGATYYVIDACSVHPQTFSLTELYTY